MRSSRVSLCCDGCNIPVTSCSFFICEFIRVSDCSPGWSMISCGFNQRFSDVWVQIAGIIELHGEKREVEIFFSHI